MAWCRKAVAHAPDDQESYVRLAYLLRRHRDSDAEKAGANAAAADKLLDDLVGRNDLSAAAYLARWRDRATSTCSRKMVP